MNLVIFSLIVNFIILAACVWLGWYILTRNTRSLISWLTVLTLFSLSGFFLNPLLAASPPPVPAYFPRWLLWLMPFWAGDVFEAGASAWLMGWQVIPAGAFWHHITMLIRPGEMTKSRKGLVGFIYLTAVSAVVVFVTNPVLFSVESGETDYLDSIQPGPLYSVFLGALFIFTLISLFNLLAAVRAAPTTLHRRQLNVLVAATGIAAIDGPVAIWAVYSTTAVVPRVTLSIIVGIPVLLLGYGVARYSALMEGRTRKRDFYYNAVAVGLVTLIYLAVTWLSVRLFDVPPSAFVFVILLAITTHSLVDFARRSLDFLFYHQETRILRSALRHLSNLIGEEDLGTSFNRLFDSVCTSIQATYGLVLWFEEDGVKRIGTYRHSGGISGFSQKVFEADDIMQLDPSRFPAPLEGAALLIPLWLEDEQAGAVVLGHPENGVQYLEEEVDRMLEITDWYVDMFIALRKESEYLAEATKLAEKRRVPGMDPRSKLQVKSVENVLRHIFDFGYLGDSDIAKFKLVREKAEGESLTHVDLGKLVREIVEEAIDKLKPGDEMPKDPIPREWYSYLILQGSYFEDRLNRDIMARLYISEGTFNRTRRGALRSVTRVLEEMEAALR